MSALLLNNRDTAKYTAVDSSITPLPTSHAFSPAKDAVLSPDTHVEMIATTANKSIAISSKHMDLISSLIVSPRVLIICIIPSKAMIATKAILSHIYTSLLSWSML